MNAAEVYTPRDAACNQIAGRRHGRDRQLGAREM
jgi:hypothetical protein